MAMDEEYLDNLLKNFEEEVKAREDQNQQEKKIISDIDEKFVSSEEDWKMDLDDLMVAAVEKSDEPNESDDVFLQSETDEVLSGNEQTEDNFTDIMSMEELLSDDIDVTQFIDELGEENESLAEINELLKKSDNNETIDTFENQGQEIQELIQETAPKKKKKAFPWKKKNKKSDKQDEKTGLESEDIEFLISLEENKQPDDSESESKKTKFFSNFLKALVQEEDIEGEFEESSGDGQLLSVSDEGKAGKKKDKKKRNRKKAEVEKGNDAEKSKKPKKEKNKRIKKEKKIKKNQEKADDIRENPKKVLSKKTFILLIAFCASLIAAIMCLSAFLPDYIEKRHAREAFYQGNYEEAYVLLYGKNLNANDTLILNRVSAVLTMERNVEVYYFYMEEGKEAKALNALLAGVRVYTEKKDKDEFGAGDEMRTGYQKILDILSQQYSLDEAEALEIIACDEVRYSERIYNIVEGTEIEGSEEKKTASDMPQDVLPEEEDIIEFDAKNEGA